MNDKPAILVGLAVFLALATFPGWYTLGSAALSDAEFTPPDLPPPAGALEFSTAWSGAAPELAGLRNAFAENGLAALSGDAVLTEDATNNVEVWDLATGQLIVATTHQTGISGAEIGDFGAM